MKIYFVFAVSYKVGHKPHRHADIDREVEAHLTRECTKGHESHLSPKPIQNGKPRLSPKPIQNGTSHACRRANSERHKPHLSPEPIHNGTSHTATPVWKDASAYF